MGWVWGGCGVGVAYESWVRRYGVHLTSAPPAFHSWCFTSWSCDIPGTLSTGELYPLYIEPLLSFHSGPLQGNLRQDANYLRHNMKDFPLNEVVAECEEYVQRLRSLAIEVSHH